MFQAEEERANFACFNSVYLGGKAADIEGLSPIDTLRKALNHALGLKLDIAGSVK
jgi:hypothetical protein